MREKDETEMQSHRRSLAVEGALLLLIDGLAARGQIPADEAEDMLRILAASSERSSARAKRSMKTVERLRRLRRGDGASAPAVR
ncbi:MAG: hypothetical protein PW791_06185 [Neorhizobium sp.]|nr:hypothetical protein [Neorhizobium sp.]